MEIVLAREEAKLKRKKVKKDKRDTKYYKQYDKVRKQHKAMKNPMFIDLRSYLPIEGILSLIMKLLHLDYCHIHDTVHPDKKCIGCINSIDIRIAEKESWIWFKLHDIIFESPYGGYDQITGFDKEKDYYFYQHFRKMIPNPQLFWITSQDEDLTLGILKDTNGDYMIIISNLEYDENTGDLHFILNGQLENVALDNNQQDVTFKLK